MRRTFVALALGFLCASSAAAQIDLQATTRDLLFASLDLVFSVDDIEGAVQALEIEETETEIRIELAADVLFDFDSADLRQEAEAALQNVAGIIREHEGAHVRVEGHTDAKGSEDYNQRLSERRAESVRDWLASAEGLRGTDFAITGFGESKPAAPNETPDGSDDPEGRQKNRRVEIVVSKE
jgi:outer membrane protein OmpA-like peptidoglycan-associated protein